MDFSFTYHPAQRQRFREGLLVAEWRTKYPDLFDDKDESLARNQPRYHFYEWLSAVLLREAMGYTALVEGYVSKTHPRKREVLRQRLPQDVLSFVEQNQSGLPDLFVFAPQSDDWFFCEVKGGPDRVQPNQSKVFEELHIISGRGVRLLKLAEFRP